MRVYLLRGRHLNISAGLLQHKRRQGWQLSVLPVLFFTSLVRPNASRQTPICYRHAAFNGRGRRGVGHGTAFSSSVERESAM